MQFMIDIQFGGIWFSLFGFRYEVFDIQLSVFSLNCGLL